MHRESEIQDAHHRLVRAVDLHGKADEWIEIRRLIVEEKADLLVGYSLDDAGKVSYAQTPAHKFDSAKRTKTKLGRFLTRRLKVDVSPQMHAEIGKIMGEDSFKDTDFEIRPDVARVYQTLSVASCMDRNPNDCLEFYRANGIPALVWKSKARALLFTLNDGTKFVDRVYPADPDTIAAYERWASESGATIRLHHGLDNGADMIPARIDGCYVPISNYEGGLPYLDTFAYLDDSASHLHYTYASGRHELKNTEGEDVYGNGGGIPCYGCSEYFDHNTEGCRIDDEYYCDNCAEQANYCEQCHTPSFDDFQEVDSEYYCESCAEESNHCERCETRTFSDVHKVGEQTWCDPCTTNHAFTCARCEELSDEEEDTFTMVNGQVWCGECYDATNSARCPTCYEEIPHGLPVYSPTYNANVCADCGADHEFSTVRPKRVHGGTAIVLERI